MIIEVDFHHTNIWQVYGITTLKGFTGQKMFMGATGMIIVGKNGLWQTKYKVGFSKNDGYPRPSYFQLPYSLTNLYSLPRWIPSIGLGVSVASVCFRVQARTDHSRSKECLRTTSGPLLCLTTLRLQSPPSVAISRNIARYNMVQHLSIFLWFS